MAASVLPFAVMIFAMFSVRTPQEAAGLIALLGDENPETRERAARDLEKLGEKAVADLEKAAGATDPEIAARARDVLRVIFRPMEDLPTRSREMVVEIESQIVAWRKAGRTAEADALQKGFFEFRRALLGWSDDPKLKDEPEVHVVGLSEGKSDTDQVAEVTVTTTDRPVILVLCAYNPIWWTVNVEAGVRLQKVILGGYHDQQVENLPKDIPVERHVHKTGDKGSFYCYDAKDDGYTRMAHRVKELTGRTVSSFLGANRYSGKPIVIGKENAEWKVQPHLPALKKVHDEAMREERERNAAELRKYQFTGVWTTGDLRRGTLGPQLAEFTGVEPQLKTLKPIGMDVQQIAIDSKTGDIYGLTFHELVKIDKAGGKAVTVEIEKRKDLPRLAWPSGIAMDTKRRRLLIHNNNGGAAQSYLYSWDLEKGTWTKLAPMGRHPKIHVLAYVPEDDRLLAIMNYPECGGVTAIQTYTADGSPAGKIDLSEPLPIRPQTGGGAIQMFPVAKDRLVILSGPQQDENGKLTDGAGGFLIDTSTGKVLASTYRKPD